MKKLLFVLVVVVLASCGHKKDIARMQAKQDSIAQLAVAKDNVILEYIAAMNDIQSNLDSIKTLEKIVSVQAAPGTELKVEAKKRIMEDIAQINDLLQKNKELVKNLQSKLRNSNMKIVELEKMIEMLTKQVGEKDAEIAVLRNELENLHVNVANLNQKIETITKESQQTIKAKTETIEAQVSELNTAFYAFGTKKELENKGVTEKEGGVLGMGKTLKLKKDFNRDYFMKIDIREFKQLQLNVKKAKLVTYHPDGSFHYTGTAKLVENLVIDNPEEFWKASKYLLLVVE